MSESAKQADGGVVVDDGRSVAMVQIVARRGQGAALRQALAPALGIDAPDRPLAAVTAEGITLCAVGPAEIWALGEAQDEAALHAKLLAAVGDTASLFDQTHGRVLFRLSGRHAADVLAKGCPIDVDDRVLPAPSACHTVLAHIPVLLVKRETHLFDVAVARSYTESFVHWLHEAVLEFGGVNTLA